MNAKGVFNMKSSTILNRMQSSNTASIAQVELLTKALYREHKLPNDRAVRFRPILGDFDIVNRDLWKTGEFIPCKCKHIGSISDLLTMFQ